MCNQEIKKKTQFSVNVNKIALLRNSRGEDFPNLLRVVADCESFGAEGITVHPRPDERHVRFRDLPMLKNKIKTELNVEGYPSQHFLDTVKQVKPAQVTLVPDAPDALTSTSGWDTKKNQGLLSETVHELQRFGCRVSLFVNPTPNDMEYAAKTGANRVEIYTDPYAKLFPVDKKRAVASVVETAAKATSLGLEINAGHGLNLDNLSYLIFSVPELREVSIGHAFTVDALYSGLRQTIRNYLKQIQLAEERKRKERM